MKKLLAAFILISMFLLGLAMADDDSETLDSEVSLENSIDHEKSTTEWEEENKFLVEGKRSTSSMKEQESMTESDQVEYEVIEP